MRKTKSAFERLVIALSLFLVGAILSPVWADGTETLGPPSIGIAAGSGTVAAGVGLASGTGTITIDVPGTVKQALLYWEGFMNTNTAGPATLTVNGTTVTGTLIGGPAFFFNGAYSSAYRADITSLGLVGQGSNTLIVTPPGYTNVSNGAGLLVIFDDGSGPAAISVRDGVDLAFVNFPEPRKSTVAQTFDFPASTSNRVANLAMFFGSVEGKISGSGPLRPNRIDITVAGVTTALDNPLASNDGDEWDTLNFPVSIPAGATTLTVQAFSINPFDPSNTTNPLPASFTWTAAALSIPSPKGALGDRVWEDLNGNGLQDAGEPNIDNATVELYKFGGGVCGDGSETFVGSQFTNSALNPLGQGGNYLFSNLDPGQYCVKFIAPQICDGAPAVFTQANVGMNNAIDSDANPATGWTAPITLVAGQTDLTVDAGVYCPAAVGDFVWNDLNEDGIQDAGEPGIDGVKVDLFTCPADGSVGTFVATTNTDASGEYLFSGLAPGSYYVKFEKPEGFVFSPLNVGDPAFDSDAQSNGQTACFDLAPGETNLTIDAGLYVPVQANAQLGDFVWHDLNADGIQNGGEPGIPGATVQLFSCPEVGDGELLATTTTNASGNYLFANLLPGDYYVVFTKPAGFQFGSPSLQGTDPEVDSDADPATGRTQCVTLAEGDINLTLDAGFYNPAALGDFVWNDLNQDGIQDAGEPGIDGVTVNLYTCPGDFIDSTKTNEDGLYSFTGLTPGSYYVEFVAPGGFVFSPSNQGGDDALDSDAGSNGLTDCVTLQSGEFNDTIDAGLYIPATAELGDFVWHDLNANGIQNAGEPGIGGAEVELFVCGELGTAIDSTTTDGTGFYLFDNLVAGSYQVKFTRPAGFDFSSPQGVGGDPASDSNADPVTGLTACITLVEGQSDRTIDAGFYKPAALGDFVWNDLNANGIQDAGEPGIPGVTVNLYTCEGELLGDITTDMNGIYSFTGLMPGSYYVLFEAPMGYLFSPQFQGNDPAKDSNADPTTGQTPCVTLISGQTDNTIDAGLFIKPVMNPGTGTPGYWRNHPNAWPVEMITIGGVTYTKSQAIAEIQKPVAGDTTRIMFPALVSAKLNVLIGNDDSCIADTIAAADAWMAQYGPVGKGVRANTMAWRIGEPLYKRLDDYNNGLLCAPSRDVVKHW